MRMKESEMRRVDDDDEKQQYRENSSFDSTLFDPMSHQKEQDDDRMGCGGGGWSKRTELRNSIEGILFTMSTRRFFSLFESTQEQKSSSYFTSVRLAEWCKLSNQKRRKRMVQSRLPASLTQHHPDITYYSKTGASSLILTATSCIQSGSP